VPVLGYERASEVAKEALRTGKPVRQILLEAGDLDEHQVDALLAPGAMTAPRTIPPRGTAGKGSPPG
jgi:aspartate ammonia-lyase